MSGKKVGLLTEGFDGCEQDVQTMVMDAAKLRTGDGAIVEKMSIPMHSHGNIDGYIIVTCSCI